MKEENFFDRIKKIIFKKFTPSVGIKTTTLENTKFYKTRECIHKICKVSENTVKEMLDFQDFSHETESFSFIVWRICEKLSDEDFYKKFTNISFLISLLKQKIDQFTEIKQQIAGLYEKNKDDVVKVNIIFHKAIAKIEEILAEDQRKIDFDSLDLEKNMFRGILNDDLHECLNLSTREKYYLMNDWRIGSNLIPLDKKNQTT